MKNLGALTKIWPRTVALLTALVIVLIAWALATLWLTLMEILAPSLLLLFSLASITTSNLILLLMMERMLLP